MHEAIIDVADQMLLPPVCSWEGCLGGPSSLLARPAAVFFGGLEAVDGPTAGHRIPMGRLSDAPPLP